MTIHKKNAVPGDGVERPIQETAKVSPSSNKEVNSIIAVLKTGFNYVVKYLQLLLGERKLLREEVHRLYFVLSLIEKNTKSTRENTDTILGNVSNMDANVQHVDAKLHDIRYVYQHEGPVYPDWHFLDGIPEDDIYEEDTGEDLG